MKYTQIVVTTLVACSQELVYGLRFGTEKLNNVLKNEVMRPWNIKRNCLVKKEQKVEEK